MWWVLGALLAASAVPVAAPGASDDVVGPVCHPKAVQDDRCRASEPSSEDYIFHIDGHQLSIKYRVGEYSVKCTGNVTLENDALPVFRTDGPVAPLFIQVQQCPVPGGSYTAAFAALNVSTADVTRLELQYLPADTPLHPYHFRDLPKLGLLNVFVSDGATAGKQHRLDALFSNLTTLTSLYLSGLELLPVDMRRLPTNLRTLVMSNVSFDNITEEILQRLTNLKTLSILDTGHEVTLNVSDAQRLTNVTLEGAAVPQNSRLIHVAMYEWSVPPVPAPWRECTALRVLSIDAVRNATSVTLPDAWVAACHRLQKLSLERVPLGEVPPRLLANATELKHLKMIKCKLRTLPVGLFDDTTLLKYLDLSDNGLLMLPSRPSNSFENLCELNLSGNRLARTALAALRPLANLTCLSIESNPLGDLCQRGPNDDSPLSNLRELQELQLSGTGARRVCPEWLRRMVYLTTLDLSNNSITNLTYAELVSESFPEDRLMSVDLGGNPITRVFVSKHDNTKIPSGVEISVDSAIHCDCDSVALLSIEAQGAFNPPLRCSGAFGGLKLSSVNRSQLQCSVEGAACPRGCNCTRGTDDAVTLACEGSGLRTPPPLAALSDETLHLLLADNHIATLGCADLPQRLMILDIRNNSLRTLDAETLEAMFSVSERRVKLSGNRFDCTCGARAHGLVAALRKYQHQIEDIETVICTDRRLLLHADPSVLCLPTIVGLTAGALTLVALLVLGSALGARPEGRRRLVRALRKLGVLRDREKRRFDAFVSFSHRDERFVVEELVTRLERAGYRLCLHYRDWAPGEWIPAQIAASVRASRRTIAVVSEHFLRSEWAQAEFREAHAAALRSTRPRLVVVLLDDLATLAATRFGADLCAFLASNTYVSRDDPFLWSKLARALPPPSGRAPASAEDGRAPPPPAEDARAPPPPDEDARAPPPPDEAPAPPAAAVRTGLARIFPILSFKSPELHLANTGTVPAMQMQNAHVGT